MTMHSQKDPKKVFKTNYCLMQVKSIAECSKSILQYFQPSLSYSIVIKIFVLSIFEWPFYTGFPVPQIKTTCFISYLSRGYIYT